MASTSTTRGADLTAKAKGEAQWGGQQNILRRHQWFRFDANPLALRF